MPHLHRTQHLRTEAPQNGVGQSPDWAPVTRGGSPSPFPQLFGDGMGAAAGDALLLNDSVRWIHGMPNFVHAGWDYVSNYDCFFKPKSVDSPPPFTKMSVNVQQTGLC
jgi:hypothetical protein